MMTLRFKSPVIIMSGTPVSTARVIESSISLKHLAVYRITQKVFLYDYSILRSIYNLLSTSYFEDLLCVYIFFNIKHNTAVAAA